jgi:imidazole glycerol-phosphate synthase subunit HisH
VVHHAGHTRKYPYCATPLPVLRPFRRTAPARLPGVRAARSAGPACGPLPWTDAAQKVIAGCARGRPGQPVTRAAVVVLDYGFGNIRSAQRALQRAGADVEVTADPHAALDADGLVVPGVGAFAACMAGLRAVRGDVVIGKRLAGSRPVLGICVGLQVLFAEGVEHGQRTEGCGEWPGVVRRLDAPVLPHMGWNTVSAPDGSRLFAGIGGEARFYFVHSYAATSLPLPGNALMTAPLITWAEHGERFIAAVENGPLSATQFHPEKSGDAGAALLANWLATI